MRHLSLPTLPLLATLALAGCGGPPAVPAETPDTAPTAAGPLKPPGEAAIGDRTTCPISHEEFVVTDASPKAERDGKTYYFCCAHCATKFLAGDAAATAEADHHGPDHHEGHEPAAGHEVPGHAPAGHDHAGDGHAEPAHDHAGHDGAGHHEPHD